MKKYLIIFTLFVSGCVASPQEQCQKAGYTPGTSEFQQCAMTVSQQQQQVLQALYMNNMQSLQSQQQQQNANSQMMMQNLNAAAANSMPRSINTNCYRMGNSINCNSQ